MEHPTSTSVPQTVPAMASFMVYSGVLKGRSERKGEKGLRRV